MVVGNIGSGARREEMAVVDETPNLAARLQAQASPGEIIIAAQTFRLVADYFDIDDLGEYKLKGISQPQTAYRVRGESGAQGRLDASASLGLTPLVGRKGSCGSRLRSTRVLFIWGQSPNQLPDL